MLIRPLFATIPKNPNHHFLRKVRGLAPGQIDYQDYVTRSTPSFIIYHIQNSSRTFRGLVALTSIDDFAESLVLPHEKTLVQKERLTFRRLKCNQAMIKPILLTFETNQKIDNILVEVSDLRPDYVYTDEPAQCRHLMWFVQDPNTQNVIKQAFQPVKQAYLADGHHRAKSMMMWSSEKQAPTQVLTAYFSFDEVHVSPYNRLILGGLEIRPDAFSQIRNFADEVNRNTEMPGAKHEFSVLSRDKVIHYKWKTEILSKAKGKNALLLDSYLVNRFIVKEVFGLKKIRENDQIIYLEGWRGIVNMVDKVKTNQSHVGICLYPISQQDFIASCHSSRSLPAKSTWFQPRLPSGLIIHRFKA